MKFVFFILLASICVVQAQQAVVVTGDPVAVAIAQQDQALQTANHSANISKWVESIQALNTQINQMQEQLNVAKDVKGYIGDPLSALELLDMQHLGEDQLGNSVGQLSRELRKTVRGADALTQDGQELFTPIDLKTPSGIEIERWLDRYKPFGAIQKHDQNLAVVIEDALSRIEKLQRDKAKTLQLLKNATTQTAAQKLQGKLAAIDGEIAALGIQQGTATHQLVAQDIANRNDRELKAQAASEAADRELGISLNNFMKWQGDVRGSRKGFQ
jgi:hypothetical protein